MRASAVALAVLLGGAAVGASAGPPLVHDVEVDRRSSGWVARVTWETPWKQPPFKELRSGVPIDFTVTLRVYRHRPWWYDAVVRRVRVQRELYYNRLTRQYRIIDRRTDRRYFTRDWGQARRLAQRSGPVPLRAGKRMERDASYYLAVRVEAVRNSLSLPARFVATLARLWGGRSDWQYRPLKP
ncbi:DUF4390 domain-containing protein [Thiohalorhabdus methylotrophus]|uniref:DUF4390 domain-containing protein n=1 Tax=Thiohalorhabdus methylotrophus TaxID=3242694 RepID=A0ABV4TT41_9GAMM